MATYADAFGTLVPSTGGAWLPELKRAAFDRFTTLGFPTTRNEDWHYTSVTPIAEKTFRPLGGGKGSSGLTSTDIAALAIGESSWHRLVFVNGRFEPGLSAYAGLPAEVAEIGRAHV